MGSITPTASHTSGDLFTEGVTTVTYDFDDGNGNISTCSFDVEIVNPVDGISTEMDVTCFGGSDGSIDITVTSGTAPFTFDWTDGGTFAASTEDISGIPAGNYTITATDANDCETGGTITITEPTEVTVSIDATSNPTGCGLADGSASVTANGGTESGAYDFDWTDGGTFSSTTEDQTGLLACS